MSPALLIALALCAPPAERTRVPNARVDPPSDVIGRERLDELAGSDVAGALDSEPGLTVNRLGGLGMFSTVAIRGATPEQALVALDGIVLNPADGSPVDLSTLPLGPLGAIDVYRGRTPWSLGQSALGGAILMRSRPARDAANAQLTLGAFDTFAASGFLGQTVGDLDLSIAIDGLHTASNFRFLNDGGTAWTTADDLTQTRTNADADQLSLLARASLALGRARLTLVDVYTLATRGLPSLGVTPTHASRFDLNRNLIALRLDVPGPLLISATTSLAASSTEVHDPLGEIGLARTTTTTSIVPAAVVTLRYPIHTADLHLTPSIHLAWRHDAIAAATNFARHVASLAAEASLQLRHLDLSAGLRGELADTATVGAFVEAAYAIPHARFTLGARLAPRLPSLFELHGDNGLTLGNPALRPESASTIDLAVRWDPSPALGIAASAYATWARDLIQFIQNAQGVTRFDNLAAARILGLELQLEATLGPLYLRSSASLMDAIDTSDIAARTGKRLPLRPTFATSHRLELRLPDAALGDVRGAIGLYLELDLVAGNHLDFANLVALPARTLLGAGAFVRADRAEVVLSLSNLLDDRVQDFAGYPLPGLTTMLSLRLALESP